MIRWKLREQICVWYRVMKRRRCENKERGNDFILEIRRAEPVSKPEPEIQIVEVEVLPREMSDLHPVVLDILKNKSVEVPRNLSEDDTNCVIYQCRELGKMFYQMSGLLKNIQNMYG